MHYLIYMTLMVLALGLLTSPTILAFSHIFIAVPALYFIPKTKYKKMNASFWALLVLIIILALSVVVNLSIAGNGVKPLFKLKYFLFGVGAIAPFTWWFNNFSNDKKLSHLIYAFCFATCVATIAGLIGTWFGFNPILFKKVEIGSRYGGLFGMVMNYAHNMSFFLIIVTGLVIFRDRLKHLVTGRFLVMTLIINLVGFYFCYTRGAWLAYLAGLPFFLINKNKKFFFAAFVSVVLLGGIFYFIAGDKVVRSYSDSQRISQWRAAIEGFKERPLTGFGYLNFESHSVAIKERHNLGELELRSHAHNNFLEILVGAGVLGILVYVAWIVLWLKEMYQRHDLIGYITIPFIIVFVVGGLTQSTISLGINLFFIMAVYALSQVYFQTKA